MIEHKWGEEKWLQAKDLKEIIGCGINRAYEIMRQPDFPKITIGRRMYVPKSEFERWYKNYLYKEYEIY